MAVLFDIRMKSVAFMAPFMTLTLKISSKLYYSRMKNCFKNLL